MNKRKIKKLVQGKKTMDGAGVHLVRVLGYHDVEDFDPFLMLDSFDSTNPNDYIEGFPMHPHRGIETFTYLIKGEIDHRDSLGNKGKIRDGESQWMNAGSGILHEEMPQVSEQLLGLQLWINLPKDEKMSNPTYRDIVVGDIATIAEDGAIIHVVAGKYKDGEGVRSTHVDVTIYDIELKANKSIVLPTKSEDNVFIFTIQNKVVVDDSEISAKTALLFDEGEEIEVSAKEDARFLFFAGKPLHESIAWGGPIVMNTRAELEHAFEELDRGVFIKHDARDNRR